MGKLYSAGVDTGMKNIGFGAVCFDTELLTVSLAYESYLETHFDQPLEDRLQAIGMATSEMANLVNPHISCVENFFAHQMKIKGKKPIYNPAAPKMYMAMGVIFHALRHHKPILMKPQEAKKAVSFFKADKDQVGAGVKAILSLNYDIGNEHTNDALALALARLFLTPIYRRSGATCHMPIFR